jgi:hypothetical protein
MCSGHGCVTSEKRTCRGGEMLICTVRCGEPIRLSYSVGAVLSLHRIARLRAYCAVAFGVYSSEPDSLELFSYPLCNRFVLKTPDYESISVPGRFTLQML